MIAYELAECVCVCVWVGVHAIIIIIIVPQLGTGLLPQWESMDCSFPPRNFTFFSAKEAVNFKLDYADKEVRDRV